MFTNMDAEDFVTAAENDTISATFTDSGDEAEWTMDSVSESLDRLGGRTVLCKCTKVSCVCRLVVCCYTLTCAPPSNTTAPCCSLRVCVCRTANRASSLAAGGTAPRHTRSCTCARSAGSRPPPPPRPRPTSQGRTVQPGCPCCSCAAAAPLALHARLAVGCSLCNVRIVEHSAFIIRTMSYLSLRRPRNFLYMLYIKTKRAYCLLRSA